MPSIREFFKQSGLVYLERCRIADSRVLDYSWESSPYYEANRAEFEALTGRYGEGLRQAWHPPVEIRHAGESVGWGLFACSDLQVGDLAGEYTGIIQVAEEAPPEEKIGGHYLSDYAWNYPDELPDGTEFEVNALREGNELRFVNHSERPNLAVDHTLVDGLFVTFFKVVRKVLKGEQLTVDYGEEYWSGGFRKRSDL